MNEAKRSRADSSRGWWQLAGFLAVVACTFLVALRWAIDLQQVAIYAALGTVFWAILILVAGGAQERRGIDRFDDQGHGGDMEGLLRRNEHLIKSFSDAAEDRVQRSFWLARVVALVGFLLIVGSVARLSAEGAGRTSVPGLTSEARLAIIAGGVGVLIEFVAATFFYIMNRSTVVVSEFHERMMELQKLTLVRRMAEELDEDDGTSGTHKKELFEGLLARLRSIS